MYLSFTLAVALVRLWIKHLWIYNVVQYGVAGIATINLSSIASSVLCISDGKTFLVRLVNMSQDSVY